MFIIQPMAFTKLTKLSLVMKSPTVPIKSMNLSDGKICGLYFKFVTICKTGYLCLAYYSSDDYSAARVLLKFLWKKQTSAQMSNPKGKGELPDRLSPSPIRKANTLDRRPMTVIHLAGFEMFKEGITGNRITENSVNIF